MPKRNSRTGDSGDTLTVRWQSPGILDALDGIDAECESAEPSYRFLRAELLCDPKRGNRVSVQLTLISDVAVSRLRAERSAAQKRGR